MIDIVTTLLAALTVLGQGIVLVSLGIVLYARFLAKKSITKFPMTIYIMLNSRKFAFGVAVIAVVGSLFYSEIAGYEPCKLCWIQRIFMYPLIYVIGGNLSGNDRHTVRTSYIASLLGALVAGYHYYLQRTQTHGIIPCSVMGYSVSCSEVFRMTFGYITIPLMAFTAFCLILLFTYLSTFSHTSKP